MSRLSLICLLLVLSAAAPKPRVAPGLPMAGTQFKTLPEGAGKAAVEAACLACHSADLLAQQRLNEKQWTATVEKMIRWGATVSDRDRPAVVTYLSRHFTPSTRFVPTRVRPIGH